MKMVLFVCAFVTAVASGSAALAAGSGTALRDAARGIFPIGVGISDRIPFRPADWQLLTNQFSILTPENCMKPQSVQAMEGNFALSTADAFVAFATSNHLDICGHCLVWAKDDRTPPWFFKDGDKPTSRELLLQRMKTHIDSVAGRYKGRIAMWDVVNEALDDGTNFLRPSGWSTIAGDEFLSKAFEYAHAADPGAMLIYNDYNNELTGKREKQVELIKLLKKRNTPIHAVGLQGHYEIDRVPFAELEEMLRQIGSLGLKVVVSELDIDVIPRSRWWADGGKYRAEMSRINPYVAGCPPEILARQADQYAQLFRLFRKYSHVIARVTFWNLHDGQSWLNGFPWERANHPLLFDRQGQPKPAHEAVIRALGETKPTGN
jgi:endo-1,4-beta-xylanase